MKSNLGLQGQKKSAVVPFQQGALAFALLAVGQHALACASCGCTLSKDWLGPQAGSTSGWSAGISYDMINQNQYQIGTRKIDHSTAQNLLNPGQIGSEVELQTATRTTTLSLNYNADDWGVTVLVPFVDKYHTTLSDGTTAGYSMNQYNTLGDVKLLGRYAGWSGDGGTGVIVGVQLPTGLTNENFNAGASAGQPIDPSLQPGTGATAIILGGFTSGEFNKVGWFAQGTWQHTVSNNFGYTPGSTIIANAGIRYAEPGQRIVPLLQFNYVHRNSDSGINASYDYTGAPLTGGNLFYVAPGVSAQLGGGVSAYGYLQLPLATNVTGVQLTPRYILSLGLRKNF